VRSCCRCSFRFGAAPDGGARLQHSLPLVRGAELGRAGLGCNDLYQKPRPITGSGGGEGVSGPSGGASTRGRADLRRALYGGRNPSGGVGEPEEFPAQKQEADHAAGRSWQSYRGFHGEKRSNQTYESKTDPDAKLARKAKGKEAQLSYSGNLLVENRNGLIVNDELLEANGRAERDAALVMLEQIPGDGRITVGGDKGFDTQEFVDECRRMKVIPHVAQNDGRRGGSAIDARTTRHVGYPVSQKKRKRIEECFGWLKDIALMRKLKHRGILKVGWIFTFAVAAYNLVRLRKLVPIQSAAWWGRSVS
jgi:hypothetical protein